MTSELSDLYQELILDHQKHPHNFGDLEGANHHADGFNPLCGDKISLNLKLDDQGVIQDIRFKGSGCAISRASASLMTDSVKGKTKEEAEKLFQSFHHLVTDGEDGAVKNLGKLKVFAGVKQYPARVKCATLAWHTFEAALKDEKKVVSTDDGTGS